MPPWVKLAINAVSGLLGFGDLIKDEIKEARAENAGAMKVVNKQQAETIHELQVDKTVSDRIDNMSDTERMRLAGAINKSEP